MAKTYLALVIVEDEETLVETYISSCGDDNLTPEKVDLQEAAAAECSWVCQSGLRVEILREASKEDLLKI